MGGTRPTGLPLFPMIAVDWNDSLALDYDIALYGIDPQR